VLDAIKDEVSQKTLLEVEELFDKAIKEAEPEDALINQLLLEHGFRNKGGRLRK
jgi:hypothetical protein